MAHLEPEEPEGNADPDVRWSTRTNKRVPQRRLFYLTKTVIVMEPSTWEDIETMPTSRAEKWRKTAAEVCRQLKRILQLMKDFGMKEHRPNNFSKIIRDA